MERSINSFNVLSHYKQKSTGSLVSPGVAAGRLCVFEIARLINERSDTRG